MVFVRNSKKLTFVLLASVW